MTQTSKQQQSQQEHTAESHHQQKQGIETRINNTVRNSICLNTSNTITCTTTTCTNSSTPTASSSSTTLNTNTSSLLSISIPSSTSFAFNNYNNNDPTQQFQQPQNYIDLHRYNPQNNMIRPAGGGKPDAKPRGRMTAYAYFVQTCREEHKKKHPDETVIFAEFSRKCAERWKVSTNKFSSFTKLYTYIDRYTKVTFQ